MSQLKIKRLHADAQGPGWYLYAIEFDAPDGAFNTHIYAINDEHAQMLCADLLESAWKAVQGNERMTDRYAPIREALVKEGKQWLAANFFRAHSAAQEGEQ